MSKSPIMCIKLVTSGNFFVLVRSTEINMGNDKW